MILHCSMVITGLILIGFSLWGIHFRPIIFEKIGSIMAPLGLIITLLGVLLLAVPDFFSPLNTMITDYLK